MSNKQTQRLSTHTISFLLLTVVCLTNLNGQDPVDADILLHDGTLYLGDGQPAVTGSVAIHADKIVAVGQFETGKIKRRIDCTGLIVSPGP